MIGPFPESEFLDLHRRLVQTLAPPNAEAPRHRLLAELFDSRGIAHASDAAGNLIVSLGSGPWAESVVLDAHLDVVERGGTRAVQNDGECLRGLGVGDDQVAVTMLALAAIRLAGKAAELPRPLVFLFSTGEEGLGNLRGVRQFVADHPSPPAAFLAFDGSRGTYSATALGSLRYRVRAETPGGHSWSGFGNPNAIELVVDYLASARQAWRLATAGSERQSSYNLATIGGGQGINSIARHAEATFEFRSVCPDILGQLQSAIEQRAEQCRRNTPTCQLDIELLGSRPAGSAPGQNWLRPLIDACLADLDPAPTEVPMSTNINIPVAHGWPAVCLGLCQSGNGHREDEYVRLDSLPIGWQSLRRLLAALPATGQRSAEKSHD